MLFKCNRKKSLILKEMKYLSLKVLNFLMMGKNGLFSPSSFWGSRVQERFLLCCKMVPNFTHTP